MKKIVALLLALCMVFAIAACGGGTKPNPVTPDQPTPDQPTPDQPDQPNPDQPDQPEVTFEYDIVVWAAEKAVDLTKKQIENFNNTNAYGIKFNANVYPVSEADAATQMLTDVQAGADIYCFAQDQFARLVQGGALAKLDSESAAVVRAANDPGVVAAATSGEELYAYPLTADNGYFMYYDKTVVPEADVDSLEAIIADCEAAGKFFSMEVNTSAWYIASWFFGTGCVSEWETDSEGNFISVNDTFNSANGLIAVKGMKKLVSSPMFLSKASGDGFANGCAVVVTGTWDFETVKGILGDNMGVADLPSFEVDGRQYHMGSFSGCKLMGVKPQEDATKAMALALLAEYLTAEECQMERFNELSWGPSNSNAQKSDAVQANPGLAALLAQSPYSVPQGQIHGSWWDIAKVIGDDVIAATDDAGLQQALDNYRDKIQSLFNMTEEEKNAWSVIGSVNGTMWDTDFPLYQVATGVFESDAFELHAGEEFKVRQGASWDVNFGKDGVAGGDNVVVEADGTYKVHFEAETGMISLIEA